MAYNIQMRGFYNTLDCCTSSYKDSIYSLNHRRYNNVPKREYLSLCIMNAYNNNIYRLLSYARRHRRRTTFFQI